MDKDTKSAILTACEENFSGFNQDQLEVELVRQIKLCKGHRETRKDYMDSYKELIDECNLKIGYIVDKIDHVQHEAAVEAHEELAQEA